MRVTVVSQLEFPSRLGRAGEDPDGFVGAVTCRPVYDRSFDGDHFDLVGMTFSCATCGHEFSGPAIAVEHAVTEHR